MKRSLVDAGPVRAVLVVGVVLLMLVSGCGRAGRHARGGNPPAGVTVPSTGPASTGPGPGGPVPAVPAGADPQLNDVDGLLGQLDGQLNSDDATPGDAD